MSTNANAGMPKEPSTVRIRLILFLVEISILYFLIWVPWHTSLPNFLFFFGIGMIQVSGTYVSESKWTVSWGDTLLSLFVMLFAIGGFIAELVVGWHAKPWWEALLLPIPPFMLASVWFKSHNPAPPFFSGILFLVLALLLKIFI